MGHPVLAVDKLAPVKLAPVNLVPGNLALDHQALDHRRLLADLVPAHQALDHRLLLADPARALALARQAMDQGRTNQIRVKTATDQALAPGNLVQHPHHPIAAAAQEEMLLRAEEALLAQDLVPVRVLARSKDCRLHRVEARDQVLQPPAPFSPYQHLPAKETVLQPTPPLPSLPGLSVA